MTTNPNEIAGYVLAELIKSTFSGVKLSAGESLDKFYFNIRAGYQSYFEALYDRFSVVKTLTHKNKPVPFDDVYVNGRAFDEEFEISNRELFDRISVGGRYVVTGTGGIGKSMLMKYILLSALRDKNSKRIPIFIELRTLSDGEDRRSILDAIQSAVTIKKGPTSADLARHGLEKGAYLILLDGFDEIDLKNRQRYEKEILKISHEYPDSVVVVSGRRDDRFGSWTDFHIYHVQPLNRLELGLLVEGLAVDDGLKAKFLTEVDKSLWKTHSDFLSNPLLATMMVMTFKDFAEIPEKVHVFYAQAFLTLYSMHDASKEYFTRESISGLSIDIFEKVFSTFCFLTYYENKISFTETVILGYIQKAIDFEKAAASSVDVLTELVESVCIIQKDGLEYVFSHRSFQEYFSALFIYRNQSIDVRRALTRISARGGDEKCISILYDMNPTLVEQRWALPVVSRLSELTEKAPVKGQILKYLEQTKRELFILSTLIAAPALPRSGDFCVLAILKKLYNEVPPTIGPDLFWVDVPSSKILDWHDEIVGRTATGRRRPVRHRELSRTLLKDPEKAEEKLEALGIRHAFRDEREWIRDLRKRLEKSVADTSEELNDILALK